MMCIEMVVHKYQPNVQAERSIYGITRLSTIYPSNSDT